MKKLLLLLAFIPSFAQAERGDFNFRELNRAWMNLEYHDSPSVSKLPVDLSAFNPSDRELYAFVKDSYAEKELNVKIEATGDKAIKKFLDQVNDDLSDDGVNAISPLLQSRSIRTAFYLYGTGDAWVHYSLVIVDQNNRVGYVTYFTED